MALFKKLGHLFRGAVNDVGLNSAVSAADVQDGLVSGASSAGTLGLAGTTWLNTPVVRWRFRHIRKWIRFLIPFGTRRRVLDLLSHFHLHTGRLLCKASWTQLVTMFLAPPVSMSSSNPLPPHSPSDPRSSSYSSSHSASSEGAGEGADAEASSPSSTHQPLPYDLILRLLLNIGYLKSLSRIGYRDSRRIGSKDGKPRTGSGHVDAGASAGAAADDDDFREPRDIDIDVDVENSCYDRVFPFSLQKILTTHHIDDYATLLTLVQMGLANTDPERIMRLADGEEGFAMLVREVLSYVFVLIRKDPVRDKFVEWFDEELTKVEVEIRDEQASGQDDIADAMFLMKVKVIIVDQIGQSQRGPAGETTLEQQVLGERVKKVLSPIVNILPFFKNAHEFGIFHVGIQLGKDDQYLEWTTCSFTCPRVIESLDSLVSIELDPVTITRDNYHDIAEKIANVVYEYNAKKMYSLLRLNCQHFVLQMCRELEINVHQKLASGTLGRFMKRIRKSGSTDMVFQPSPEFVARYQLQAEEFQRYRPDGEFLFATHQELDMFGIALLRNAKRLDGDDRVLKETDEWKLLNGWDESIWIRYFSSKRGSVDREAFQRVMYYHRGEDLEILCPFIGLEHHHPDEEEGEDENPMLDEDLSPEEERIWGRIMRKNQEWNDAWYESYVNESYDDAMRSAARDSLRFVGDPEEFLEL